MAPGGARGYLRDMSHHHIASFVAIFAGLFGAGIAIFAGALSARRPGTAAFDFTASARRIRARAIPARHRA
jgi:hypothetical protein